MNLTPDVRAALVQASTIGGLIVTIAPLHAWTNGHNLNTILYLMQSGFLTITAKGNFYTEYSINDAGRLVLLADSVLSNLNKGEL